MQTNCPQCSQKLVVEDDKVPAGPYLLRCPKCQKTLKLPGKSTASATPPSDTGAPAAKTTSAPSPAVSSKSVSTAPPPPAPGPPPTPVTAVASPAPLAEPADNRNGRALVCLPHQPDQGLEQAVIALLQRSGYGIDTSAEAERGVQLLERTSYHLVVTSSNGAGGDRVSLYKRVIALAPEVRRNLFLVLLGNEFSSGDGTQAFAAMADLVLNPRDVASSEELLRSTVSERARLFKAFQEAQVRLDRRKY